MAGVELYPHQQDAVKRMRDGCILKGGVGSGKSRTAIAYYWLTEVSKDGKSFDWNSAKKTPAKDLYIITTALKRDKLEWETDLQPFAMSTHEDANILKNRIIVDSWNNITKYRDVKDAFFIFDEQRLVGYGAWVKSFLKIAKTNRWILLSATPGDTWKDYIPVFIANGFYRTKGEFSREHIVYDPHCKNYPKIDRYLNTGRLIRLRDRILIDMDFERTTKPHHEDVYVKYDMLLYKQTTKERKDPFTKGYIPCFQNDPESFIVGQDISSDEVKANMLTGFEFDIDEGMSVKLTCKPIENAAGLCYAWRRIVNSDVSRQVALLEIFEDHPKMIVFYNFDYELEILKGLYYGTEVPIAEWNGHKHQPIPDGDTWVYLVQYTAGCEGWNCIKTDTIVFFSQNYSFKVMEQAAGRIDRLNTPYTDLYYYHLKTRSGIDLAISRALAEKKQFNETRYLRKKGVTWQSKAV